MEKIYFDNVLKQIRKMTEINLFHVIIKKELLDTESMHSCLEILMEHGLEMPEHHSYVQRYYTTGVATGFLTPPAKALIARMDFVEAVEIESSAHLEPRP